MTKFFAALMMLPFFIFCLSPIGFAEKMSNQQLLEEIQMLKQRIQELESHLGKDSEKDRQESQGDIHAESGLGVKGLADRVRRIEQSMDDGSFLGGWSDRINISGLIEVEAGFESMDYDDPALDDETSSDVVLATMELGVDAAIAKHVGGHLLFLWEEDDTEPVDLDEGFITLDGEDVVPMYLNAGKMYVPFGRYESHFISDPLTLEIGETNESALRVGYANDWVEICLAAFNGDVDKAGDDDRIDDYVAAVVVSPQLGFEDFGLTAGLSYISNIGDSDGLEGETPGQLEDNVPGLGGFVSVAFQDRFFMEGEFVTATDHFQAGELSFDNGEQAEPETWNLEAAFLATDDLEVALRYEGSSDLGDFLPEKRYGAALAYALFENTTLAVEYLRGSFENNDEADVLTTQLGIEF